MFCTYNKILNKLDKEYILQHFSKEWEASYYMIPFKYMWRYRIR
jgi:hypothetical protein